MDSWPPDAAGVEITRFEPASAAPAELAEYVRLQLAARAADQPAEPALPREWAIARLTRASSADRQRFHWAARDARTGELAGVAELMLLADRDTDLAAIDVAVTPGRRRRGIGTALLRELAAAAGSRHCLFIEGIRAGTPAEAWADAHGFAVVQRTVQLTLDLSAVDRARWEVPAAPGYRLAQWTGSAPASLVTSYAAARNAIYQAPHGDMSFTEPDWSPERVRDEEAAARNSGCELSVVVAVHEQTGQVAGLTYLEVHQHRPGVASQQDTAVLREHRGHGLGAWVKAANLRRLAAEHPAVRQVRTSNAADNEHMLRVNRQVGFIVQATTQNREADLASLTASLTANRPELPV